MVNRARIPRQGRAQGRRTGLVFGAGASSISACSGSLSACTASAGPIQIGSAAMVPARIGRVRMDQNAQIAMVEHQPGHQFGEYLAGKGHLVHGLIVRTDLDVVPAPERDREALADPGCATARPRPASSPDRNRYGRGSSRSRSGVADRPPPAHPSLPSLHAIVALDRSMIAATGGVVNVRVSGQPDRFLPPSKTVIPAAGSRSTSVASVRRAIVM